MATRFLVRTGTQSQITTLEVGELGYVTDIKALLVGDGSGQPSQLMTTKSTGTYDYRTTDLVKFNAITANLINGISFSQFNAANGLLTRIGNNQFASRTLISGNGSISFVNPDGVSSNPDIRINPDLDLSAGTKGLILPRGPATTDSRGANIVGKLRYAINTGSDPYKTPEIYSVDGAWRVIKEFITQGDYSLTVGVDYTTVQDCISRHLIVDCSGSNIINFQDGTFTIGSAINLNYRGAPKHWYFRGSTPLVKTITSVQSVSGTTSNWTVQYNLSDVSGISAGQYLLVDGLRGYSAAPIRGKAGCVSGQPNLNSYGFEGTIDYNTCFTYDLNVGDYIDMCGPDVTSGQVARFLARVTGIPTATSLVLNSNCPFTNPSSVVYTYHSPVGAIWVDAATGLNVTGVGTTFTIHVNVNDIIMIGHETRRVLAVNSDTSITLTAAANINVWPTSSGGAVQFFVNNNPELHTGAWVVTAVDSVNSRVSVKNTALTRPPVLRIGAGSCKVIKTIISFNNPASDGFQLNGSSATFENMVILSPTSNGVYGIYATNASSLEVNDIACIGQTAGSGIYVTNSSVMFTQDADKSICCTNCFYGIRLELQSNFVCHSQIIINTCSFSGIHCVSTSSCTIYHNTRYTWKINLTVTDCFNGCYCQNQSTFFTYIKHIAHCSNIAFRVDLNCSLNNILGSCIHDCAFGVYTINGSTCYMNHSRILHISTTLQISVGGGINALGLLGGDGYSIQCQINSTCVMKYCRYCHGHVHVQLHSLSSCFCHYSFILSTFSTAVIADTVCNMQQPYCYVWESGVVSVSNVVVVANNIHINCNDSCYHDYRSCHSRCPSAFIHIKINLGCFFNSLTCTFLGSTTHSPVFNTTGNSSCYHAH